MDLLALREPVSALSHGAGMLLSLSGIPFLWQRSRGDRGKRASLLIYSATMAACFAASASFHAVRGPEFVIAEFNRLDHIGIYLYIAGCYTCLCCNLLCDAWRSRGLWLAWTGAGAGVGLETWCDHVPPAVSVSLYLAFGWGCALLYLALARKLSHRRLRPLLVGGVLYTIGAVLFVTGWPILWPGVFGAHELFHLFVLAGSLAHFQFVLRVVVPARRRPVVAASTHAGSSVLIVSN